MEADAALSCSRKYNPDVSERSTSSKRFNFFVIYGVGYWQVQRNSLTEMRRKLEKLLAVRGVIGTRRRPSEYVKQQRRASASPGTTISPLR